MGNSSPEQQIPRAQQAPRAVRVVNWPLRDGAGAWLLVILIGAIAATAGFFAQSGAMGGLCFVALSLAVWRLWIPTTFEFRSRGVIYTVLGRSRQIPWTQIGRYEARKRGLLLFPDSEPVPLAAFRSLFIRWNGQQQAILDAIEFYTQPRTPVASTRTVMQQEPSESAY